MRDSQVRERFSTLIDRQSVSRID
jgi:hypothetical protein